MSGFLKYWDTRIIRNQRVFDAHPQIANFAYCECEKIWDHMEEKNNVLLARHNALVEAVAWERECDVCGQWLHLEFWANDDKGVDLEEIADIEAFARAEVDRLIADCKGEG